MAVKYDSAFCADFGGVESAALSHIDMLLLDNVCQAFDLLALLWNDTGHTAKRIDQSDMVTSLYILSSRHYPGSKFAGPLPSMFDITPFSHLPQYILYTVYFILCTV